MIQANTTVKAKVRITIVSLYISLIVYVLVAVVTIIESLLASEFEGFVRVVLAIMGIVSIFIVWGLTVVVKELKQQKTWAWGVALAISIFYLSSIFIPLGILGLIGLLNKDTRRVFQIGV